VKKFLKSRKGAAMVEYALLVAGIAVVAVVAVSVLGHKTSDLLGTAAAILPGVNSEDNAPITAGQLIETSQNGSGVIDLDIQEIVANQDTERLGNNLGYSVGELPNLVVQTTP
jgi:Flp pilus assembly pilin Flp